MSSPRFFKIDINSLKKGIYVFNYNRFQYEKVANDSYSPIYIMILPNSINCYFQGFGSFSHFDIFSIPISDNPDSENSIAESLNLIFTKNYSALEDYTNEQISNFSPAYSTVLDYKYGKQEPYTGFSLRELFLDFLFDFHYSDLFKQSPHYQKAYQRLSENHLFNTLFLKAECYFHKNKYQSDQNLIQKEELDNVTNKWFTAIMDESSPKLLGDSPWFEKNLEVELKEFSKLTGHNWKLLEIAGQNLCGDLSEWFLARLNFIDAYLISGKKNKAHSFLFLAVLFITVLIPFFFFHQVIGFVLLYLTSSILLLLITHDTFDNIRKINFLQIFSLFMPKLTLTIFTTWIILYGFALGKIPVLGNDQMILYFIFAVILVFIYLAKELTQLAPDLNKLRYIWGRIIFIIMWAFLVSGLVGGIIISFALKPPIDPQIELLEICFDFCGSGLDIAFWPWMHGTFFVFFTGLFVNLLFRGQKFTGF